MIFNKLSDYFNVIPNELHFLFVPELSTEYNSFYKMNPEYGKGILNIIYPIDEAIILIGDFTPQYNFEKVSEINQNYVEISKFDTTSSSYKVGKKHKKRVEVGISCYINNNKLIQVFCDKNKAVKFVKIVLTENYFNTFLRNNYINNYKDFKSNFYYISQNPVSPELNNRNEKKKTSLKVSSTDKLLLKKCIKLFQNNLSAYPSLSELASICCMSVSKFLLAFKYLYGVSPYKYLKNMRMEAALDLLLDIENKITVISENLGYKNSGHFAKLFKEYYGISPKEYRNKNIE